jgi:hypothetical protein
MDPAQLVSSALRQLAAQFEQSMMPKKTRSDRFNSAWTATAWLPLSIQMVIRIPDPPMNCAQPERSVEIQDAEMDLKKLAREDQESYADKAGEPAAHTGPAHSALERCEQLLPPWLC